MKARINPARVDVSNSQRVLPACQERVILEGRYRADLKVYLSVVSELEDYADTKAFDDAYERAERAKRSFEHARDTLYSHVAAHACDDSGGEPAMFK